MKAFVKHYLRDHRALMLAKSKIDCHARGVDSILFDDTPESRIRLFIARPQHELWRNGPPRSASGIHHGEEMSVAFHPHHCDLILHLVQGSVVNSIGAPSDEDISVTFTPSRNKVRLSEYLYRSAITEGECAFELQREVAFLIESAGACRVGDQISLEARQMHTMYVPPGRQAAWFVYEGREDPDYKAVCYSNAKLSKFDATGMYQPMSEEYLVRSLQSVFGAL